MCFRYPTATSLLFASLHRRANDMKTLRSFLQIIWKSKKAAGTGSEGDGTSALMEEDNRRLLSLSSSCFVQLSTAVDNKVSLGLEVEDDFLQAKSAPSNAAS